MELKAELLLEAVRSQERVTGLTHQFYRYPARFSPLFTRAAIRLFSHTGDVVLDPFMGGGTTLVEARAAGRIAVGTDINDLAVFVAKVKTTVWPESVFKRVNAWGRSLSQQLNTRASQPEPGEWANLGYHRNISGRSTWRLKKLLEIALARLNDLPRRTDRAFARYVLLKTGQWALDCRASIPSVGDFREALLANLAEMVEGARGYAEAVAESEPTYSIGGLRTICLHRSVVGLETDRRLATLPAPSLILTSPPYPGVHVLYHRWQVRGRRETPAPFWITGCFDGNGASFYTFGDRKQEGLARYFEHARAAFRSLARIASDKTLLVQMLAFSKSSWQLPKYLRAMEEAGFEEIFPFHCTDSPDSRVWRSVPNRKWYAQGALASGSEAVLFHRLARAR